MPTPREVFNNPSQYWAFLVVPVDKDFEGQHFDRKEAGRTDANGTVSNAQVGAVIDNIKECISAFSNSNVEGGLLVMGIGSDGAIKGVNHLSEAQRNSITNFDNLVVNQSAEVKFYNCTDERGVTNQILLIYTSYTENAICETPGRYPKGWIRSGPQNVPLTQVMRDRLKERKRILSFENTYCCEFRIADIDKDVLLAFRRVFVPEAVRELSDEELLYQAGAIFKKDDVYWFTNAGLLFFSANPQRVLSSAYIRLIRFNAESSNMQKRGLPTFDKPFTGPITKQIRDARSFFRESGFFKIYQLRKPDGGFKEDPEYPPIAIDEAIVNAVTHRDYTIGLPIECEVYKDNFIVRNPGRIIQRDVDLPDEFSLADRNLDSMPRNPKLLEWLKIMKDPEGKSFVQAISEGTKKMMDEMSRLDLPAPSYKLSDNQTALILESNSEIRETVLQSLHPENSTEFANLFPLKILQGKVLAEKEAFQIRYKEFLTTLRDFLLARDWYIDRFSFSRIIAHRRGSQLDIPVGSKSRCPVFIASDLSGFDLPLIPPQAGLPG